MDDPADHEVSASGHAAIVDAIEAGDERRAAEGVLNVIDTGVNRINATRRKHGAGR